MTAITFTHKNLSFTVHPVTRFKQMNTLIDVMVLGMAQDFSAALGTTLNVTDGGQMQASLWLWKYIESYKALLPNTEVSGNAPLALPMNGRTLMNVENFKTFMDWVDSDPELWDKWWTAFVEANPQFAEGDESEKKD